MKVIADDARWRIEQTIGLWRKEQRTHYEGCIYEHPKCMASFLYEALKDVEEEE